MSDYFTEEDVIARITRLDRVQLISFIEAEFVRPERGDRGFVFQRIDIARLELLVDLSQDLELDETALGVVVSLLDQLHAARQERAALRRAIAAIPEELQVQIRAALAAS
jgi:chaperone modulatory protein CbpM